MADSQVDGGTCEALLQEAHACRAISVGGTLHVTDAADESDSDIEIISGPTPSPKPTVQPTQLKPKPKPKTKLQPLFDDDDEDDNDDRETSHVSQSIPCFLKLNVLLRDTSRRKSLRGQEHHL